MFSFSSPQIIHYGRGQSEKTSQFAASFGQNVLLIHGANAGRADWLLAANQALGLRTIALSCYSEPSLPEIEATLVQLQGFSPDVVIGLGVLSAQLIQSLGKGRNRHDVGQKPGLPFLGFTKRFLFER